MLVESLVRFALLGSSWVLYVLLALSVVSFAAMFERFLFFRRNRAAGSGLRHTLKNAIAADDDAAIARALTTSASLEASVLAEAYELRHGGPQAFGDALESALGHARGELERSMTLLGTLGNNAPFIGLFGTVLGVIEAFSHLGSGDDAAMTGVMAGIAEALVATGVGIFVAIPAVVAFNVAQKKIGDLENDTASLGKLISAHLHALDRAGRAPSERRDVDARALAIPRTVSTPRGAERDDRAGERPSDRAVAALDDAEAPAVPAE